MSINRIKIIILFYFICSIAGCVCIGQVDSLKNLLLVTKNDSARVKILNQISEICEYNEIEQYSYKAFLISEVNLKNKLITKPEWVFYIRQIALSINNIAYSRTNSGNANSGIKLSLLSYKLYSLINDEWGKGVTAGNLGFNYYNKGELYLALDYYEKGLKSRLAISDSFGIANSYHNLALFYQTIIDYKKALFYNYKSLFYRKKTNDYYGLAYSYNALGDVYFNLRKYDSAEYYIKKKYFNKRYN